MSLDLLLGEERATYLKQRLPKILQATDSDLKRYGITEEEIKRIRDAFDLVADILNATTPQLCTPKEVAAYTFALNKLPHERLLLIEVDATLAPMEVRSFEGEEHQLRIEVDTLLQGVRRSFFLVHNHPSGFCTPSLEDKRFTRDIRNELVSRELSQQIPEGTQLLDHIVVGGGRWWSIDTGETSSIGWMTGRGEAAIG